MTVDVTTGQTTAPGLRGLRPAPEGLPDPNIQPPTLAEPGDPFTGLRVVHLLARIERGRPVGLDDLVAHLNATYLDWIFERAALLPTVLQLQANWMADYRNSSGIVIDDGPGGAALTIEDSTRVDPWIVRQAQRLAAECTSILDDFSRRERVTGGD